ncbi:hypothetical protein WA158_007903 [Blastocystis sp. Blastoise]
MSIASFFGIKKPVKYEIKLTGEDEHPKYRLELVTGASYIFPIYDSSQDFSGKLKISVSKGHKLEHQGLTLALVGEMQDFNNNAKSYEFLTVPQQLSKGDTVFGKQTIKFSFKKTDFKKTQKKDKIYESYYGLNVRVRYYLRLTVHKKFASSVALEKDIWIIKNQKQPEKNNPIKMEVGIEDCLHIEFLFEKSKYHLDDIIYGKIQFYNVKIKIVHMEIELLRKEINGDGENAIVETETIATYEVMDGCPMKGDVVPVRIFLRPYDVSPTVNKAFGCFNIKYYINLVLVDEEDRRFFKQSEVVLWREKPISLTKKTKDEAPKEKQGQEEEEEEEEDPEKEIEIKRDEDEEQGQGDDNSEVDDIQD